MPPRQSTSLPVRLPDRLNEAVRAEAKMLKVPASSIVRSVLADRYGMPEESGRHSRAIPADDDAPAPKAGNTPSQAVQHAAMLIAALGQQTDAIRAAGDAVPPDLLDIVRATSQQVVACALELR